MRLYYPKNRLMEAIKKYYEKIIDRIVKNKFFIRVKTFFLQKDVIVFMVFVIISTFIWLFNALRNDFTYEYNLKVKLTNIPEEMILLSPSTQKLDVKIEGVGYSLIRQAISNKMSPISYDVSKLHISKNKGHYLLASDQYDKILSQLLVGVDLLKVSPDTLCIKLEPKAYKKLAVKFDGELSFQKQYTLSDEIKFTPDSVLVSGYNEIIDTMQYVYTSFQRFFDVSDTIKKSISLKKERTIEYSCDKVNLIAPVELFTEKSIVVPIENPDLNDSVRLKLFPPDIKIVFRTGMSKFDKINEKDFSITVDNQSLLNDERPQRLKVKLEYDNPFIQRVDFSPIYVDYLLEKK